MHQERNDGINDANAENQVNNEIVRQRVQPAQPAQATQQDTLRRSQRSNFGVPPARLINEIDFVQHFVANTEQRYVEPKTFAEAIASDQKQQWIEAMNDEMKSLKKNGTWTLCELPSDRKAIGCKWVYKLKTNADGSACRFKARLVAQGFSQKYGTDYDQVSAPVVRQTTFRILLSVAGRQ